MADRPALARCVGPDVDTFAADVWGKAPLLRKASGTFDDLLTLRDIDGLLSERGLRTPFLRMARAGRVLDSSQFTSGGGVGAEVGDQVADDKVLHLFGDGATVVLQGLHRMWPSLIEFGTRLGTDLGHPVQINAYVTPASSQGFSAHYDVHDVFVLQIAGQKRWRIHEPVLPAPLRDQPWTDHRAAVEAAAAQTPLIEGCCSPATRCTCPGGTCTRPRRWARPAFTSPSECTSGPDVTFSSRYFPRWGTPRSSVPACRWVWTSPILRR